MKKVFAQNLVTLAFILAAGFFVNQKVAAASFDFSPATGNYTRGCTNQVLVYIDATGQNSNAADIEITYNPTDLNIVDADTSASGTQVTLGDAYSGYVYDQVDTGLGKIKVAAASAIGDLTSKKTFIKIDFIAQPAAVSDNFTINFTGSGNSLDSNIADTSTSQDILTSVTNASYTFSGSVCPTATPTPSPTPTTVQTTQVVVSSAPTIIVVTQPPITGLPQTGNSYQLTANFFFKIINLTIFGNISLAQFALNTATLLPLLALVPLIVFFPILRSVNKHYWGLVFDRNTRRAIQLAEIHLYDQSSKKLLGTRLSDIEGRYGFMLGEGSYQMVVSKDGYEKYKEEFTITKNQEFYSKDIALSLNKHNNLITLLKVFIGKISTNVYEALPVVTVLGLVISLLANIYAFNYLNATLSLAYTLILVLFLFMRISNRAVSGKALNGKSKQEVSGAIIKLFSPQKQLEDTVLTNSNGAYSLAAADGVYIVRVLAEGYQQPANSNPQFAVASGKAVSGKILLDRHV